MNILTFAPDSDSSWGFLLLHDHKAYHFRFANIKGAIAPNHFAEEVINRKVI
jgi:hypothetical protein